MGSSYLWRMLPEDLPSKIVFSGEDNTSSLSKLVGSQQYAFWFEIWGSPDRQTPQSSEGQSKYQLCKQYLNHKQRLIYGSQFILSFSWQGIAWITEKAELRICLIPWASACSKVVSLALCYYILLQPEYFFLTFTRLVLFLSVFFHFYML